MSEEFTLVGTTSDWFFWGFQEFEGKAYFGTYQMQDPKIYCHPPWEALVSFPGGESVLGLKSLSNKLYAASEDMGYAGKIYRRDSPSVWVPVHQETSWYPKPFENFKGYLYSAWTNEAKQVKVLRSSDGVSWSEVASWQKKGIFNFVKHNGELYLLGCFEPSTESWATKTSDGTNWSDVSVLCHHTYPSGWGSGVSVEGNLFLGQIGGKSIYKYANNTKEKVFEIPESVYGIHSGCKYNGEIWFLFGQRWKAPSGSSYLYKSPTGEANTWERVATFDKPNALCMGVCDNELYLGIQNTVYKIPSNEIITDKTIIHSCNVKISYQASSFPENNDALSCPNCGMALGIEGIRGSERIVEEPPPPPKYIVIDSQKIFKPTLVGKDGEGDWYGVWSNVKYWIRHWDIVQSMLNQEVPQGDVSPYPMPGDNKYFKSIPDFPEELLYKEVVTTYIITCPKCSSQLKLTISSIPEKNTEQYCPVCGEPAD